MRRLLLVYLLLMLLTSALVDGVCLAHVVPQASESLTAQNDEYLSVRVRLGTTDSALLVSTAGKPPSYNTAVAIFLRLARSIGLRGKPGRRGPRIHDLRHTFAVRSLEQCRHDREAVARHVVALSTYLGHAHVTDTYWYLHATPILMGQIAEAGEALHREHAS